jgi:hypothetical protein
VAWEVAHFRSQVRIGLEVSVGPGKTWKSNDALVSMIGLQESATPPRKVDIHDLVQFHDAVAVGADQ